MEGDQQIVIEIRSGVLTVGASAMSLAELNLYLDIAKRQMLEQGKPDVIFAGPESEEATVLSDDEFANLPKEPANAEVGIPDCCGAAGNASSEPH